MAGPPEPCLRAAFFDIGTNTIHMLVVEIRKDLRCRILEHEKDNTRLGDGSFRTHNLRKDTMHRGVEVIDRFYKIAKKRRVAHTVAVATSAVRDAENGRQFAAAVYRKTGIRIRIISGDEESRLIFLGALSDIPAKEKRMLVIDVGGGSMELIVGREKSRDFLESFPLGVARLTDLFLKKDPPSPKELKKLERHIEKTLKKAAKKIKKLGFKKAVGTSGTIINLGSMIYEMEEKQPLYPLNHYEFSKKGLRKVHDKITSMGLRERLKFPGLDAKRSDLIVAGSTLMLMLMKLLKFKKITLSDGGIREGMIVDFIDKNRRRLAFAGAKI